MFDVPSRDDIARVEITAEVVRENAAPNLVPKPAQPVRGEKTA